MERRILAVIIGGAFLARAFAIWMTRPEFVGWFNHSYYYWVQVRGVLESGQLPYADLPLLFYLYGAVARLFQLAGMELQPSIVNASRFMMSIVPALIACPTYLTIRRINEYQSLTIGQWILVGVSAFLPLTFVHMPELLQKNAFGLLLLSCLMYATYAWLDSRSMKWLIGAFGLFILIAFTHLGTLAVALLSAVAVMLALLYCRTALKLVIATSLSVVVVVVIGLTVVYLLDVEAFGRILRYEQSSVPNSLLGGLFSPGTVLQKLMLLLGVLIPLAGVIVLVTFQTQHRDRLPAADRLFLLSSIVLLYLLMLPVLDLDIVPRFVLFAPLPLLVVFAYFYRFGGSQRLKRILLGLASAGVLLMLFGETMNLLMLYPK